MKQDFGSAPMPYWANKNTCRKIISYNTESHKGLDLKVFNELIHPNEETQEWEVGVEREWYNEKTNLSSPFLPQVKGVEEEVGVCYLRPRVCNGLIKIIEVIS